MHILGVVVSLVGFLLEGALLARLVATRLAKSFPLYFSYLGYSFCGFLGLYLIYWLRPRLYPTAYWMFYLVSILAEFAVLAEISDQIFRLYPALRKLGRAITIAISAGLGAIYVLPSIFGGEGEPRYAAILDFALRTAVTKAIVVVVLFYLARHYRSELDRNVAGLMLGFSIYLAMLIAALAAGKLLGPSVGGSTLWVMAPLATTLCQAVWTYALWEKAPARYSKATSPALGADSEAVALELRRFNNELSKFWQR